MDDKALWTNIFKSDLNLNFATLFLMSYFNYYGEFFPLFS
jgi:hypothetical protein